MKLVKAVEGISRCLPFSDDRRSSSARNDNAAQDSCRPASVVARSEFCVRDCARVRLLTRNMVLADDRSFVVKSDDPVFGAVLFPDCAQSQGSCSVYVPPWHCCAVMLTEMGLDAGAAQYML